MNTFDKLQRMSDEDMDIRLAPLQNIISVDIKGVNGEITIGVDAQMARELMAFMVDDDDVGLSLRSAIQSKKPTAGKKKDDDEQNKKEFVGGFLLADKKQFDAIGD